MGSDINALQANLAAANARLTEAYRALAPKHVGGEVEECEAARHAVWAAERALAAAEGRPYAIRADFPLQWDVGAPLPLLLQLDSKAVLLFLLAEEGQIGVVDFDWCLATKFGSPGDETFAGHPLNGSGFEPYTAMKVIGSRWIEELRRIDSVHSRHDPSSYDSYDHLILPFHDTTFECVTPGYTTSIEHGSLFAVAQSLFDRLE